MTSADSNSSRLQFAANLKWLFTERPFFERFDAAAKAGFSGVEYASPYEYPAAHLAQRLADNGLTQALINTPVGPTGSDAQRGMACLPNRVAEYRESVHRALEYADVLGCRVVHVVAGVRPAGLSRDRAFAQYVQNISWAATAAKGSGVKLVLESQNSVDSPGFMLESQDQAAAVVEAIGSEGVGLLFDFYHAQTVEGNVSTTFSRLLPLIGHLQIADVPGRHEPGTGELNWVHILRLIADSGYAGWIGCEYAPMANTETGLAWMKETTP